jgi:CheY-like chemotaxis protein
MSDETKEAAGLLLSDDLIFTSRITATARQLGLPVHPVRSPAALQELAARAAPACVILDLANPGLAVADLVRHLHATCRPPPFVVAYGSHVETATLRAAREAGCDLVLPRSKFVEDLPNELPGWFTSRRTPQT